MAVTTANTHLRTCQQALDEAGEDSRGPFGTVISLLTDARTDECTTSQIISQAVTEIAKAPPKQGKKKCIFQMLRKNTCIFPFFPQILY